MKSFTTLYNTHYAALDMKLDFQKAIGAIVVAESTNKSLSPNQITPGQKIYDWENQFYMNIGLNEFNKLKNAINGFYSGQKINETIFTDQSKSKYNAANISKKTLSINNTDQQGNLTQHLNFIVMMHYLDGNKRNIYYKMSADDIHTFYNYVKFGSEQLNGLSCMFDDLIWYITGKSTADIYKSQQENAKQVNNKQQNYQTFNNSDEQYQQPQPQYQPQQPQYQQPQPQYQPQQPQQPQQQYTYSINTPQEFFIPNK